MDKIDWVTKLSSRKFWAAVTGFLTAILTIFEVDNLTIEQIIGLVSALSVLIAYIIGEGMVDSARASAGQESITSKADRV
ncbi:hypothetical protein MASR1M31_19450 [Porphyromonadaceae bacterium]